MLRSLVSSLGFGFQGFGFRVSGSGFRAQGFRFQFSGSSFRVAGSEFRALPTRNDDSGEPRANTCYRDPWFVAQGAGFRRPPVRIKGTAKAICVPIKEEEVWGESGRSVRFSGLEISGVRGCVYQS